METQTIITLREIRDEIKLSLKDIKASQYEGQKFGLEKEFGAKGLVGGVNAILLDISALTKATNKFIQISSHAERNILIQHFSSLRTYINNKDLQSLAVTLDLIKPILRDFGVRQSNERIKEFDDHIDGVQKKAAILSTYIDDVSTIKEESKELKSEIEGLHEELTTKFKSLKVQEEKLEGLLEKTENGRIKIEEMLLDDEEKSEEINELLVNVRSHTEVIDGFSKKITTRETQLERQEVLTSKYKEKIIEFQKVQEKYLEQANSLIESAKLALEYKTAEGLSAAFIEQYNKSSNYKTTLGWLVSAGLFVFLSLSVGIWIVSEQGIRLETVLGRISLLPILIGGAWFCAGQYIKQKNISEDYAYKSTLAKSMVGFSDQLSGKNDRGSDYSYYIQSVLSQIHNDPLRRDTSKNANSKDMKVVLDDIKDLKKIVGLLGSVPK